VRNPSPRLWTDRWKTSVIRRALEAATQNIAPPVGGARVRGSLKWLRPYFDERGHADKIPPGPLRHNRPNLLLLPVGVMNRPSRNQRYREKSTKRTLVRDSIGKSRSPRYDNPKQSETRGACISLETRASGAYGRMVLSPN
jgi:hypothetical protein